MKKILVAGNSNYGLAEGLKNAFTEDDVTFISRSCGYDLTKADQQQRFAELSDDYDIIIMCSALWKFNQTLLLEATYKRLKSLKKKTYIIVIGSTIDRINKATDWMYGFEKKALRDYCNSLSLNGVWNEGPRVTYISIGTLDNLQHKHPERITMKVTDAANYVKWLTEQPAYLHINEISIDPLQT